MRPMLITEWGGNKLNKVSESGLQKAFSYVIAGGH